MDDELIERVARGIAQADEQNGAAPYDARIRSKYAYQHLREEAQAALSALKPGDELGEGLEVQPSNHGEICALEAAEAMREQAAVRLDQRAAKLRQTGDGVIAMYLEEEAAAIRALEPEAGE